MFMRVKRAVNPNSPLIDLNEPLNDILKTPEVPRGALGDISRMSIHSEDISETNVAQQTLRGGRLWVGHPAPQLALHRGGGGRGGGGYTLASHQVYKKRCKTNSSGDCGINLTHN